MDNSIQIQYMKGQFDFTAPWRGPLSTGNRLGSMSLNDGRPSSLLTN